MDKSTVAFSNEKSEDVSKYDNNIKLETKQSGRYDRGRPELNEYCYIPIEILKKVY